MDCYYSATFLANLNCCISSLYNNSSNSSNSSSILKDLLEVILDSKTELYKVCKSGTFFVTLQHTPIKPHLMEKFSEKILESKLRIDIKKLGGVAFKFVSPGINGVPDRLILMPGGRVFFAELKSTGCKPTPLQLHMHRQLRELGFQVFVIDDAATLVNCINEVSAP